jgi:hypothetical protein
MTEHRPGRRRIRSVIVGRKPHQLELERPGRRRGKDPAGERVRQQAIEDREQRPPSGQEVHRDATKPRPWSSCATKATSGMCSSRKGGRSRLTQRLLREVRLRRCRREGDIEAALGVEILTYYFHAYVSHPAGSLDAKASPTGTDVADSVAFVGVLDHSIDDRDEALTGIRSWSRKKRRAVRCTRPCSSPPPRLSYGAITSEAGRRRAAGSRGEEEHPACGHNGYSASDGASGAQAAPDPRACAAGWRHPGPRLPRRRLAGSTARRPPRPRARRHGPGPRGGSSAPGPPCTAPTCASARSPSCRSRPPPST